MELTLLPATGADTETVIRLNKELIDRYEDIASIPYDDVMGWVRRTVTENIGAYRRIFCGGRHAGYLYFHPEGEKMALDDLFVFPQFQGRGIGTAAVRQCLAESEKTVSLHAFIKNEGAVRLYQRLGFEVVEKIGGTRYRMEYKRAECG